MAFAVVRFFWHFFFAALAKVPTFSLAHIFDTSYALFRKRTDYFIASWVVLTLFGAYRHANPIYFGRLRLRNLTHPPPAYDKSSFDWRKDMPPSWRARGQAHAPRKVSRVVMEWFMWVVNTFAAYFTFLYGWIVHVLRVSDKEFIQTAGLDGFAFLRVAQLGVQIFFPIAAVVCTILIPIHMAIGEALNAQYEEDVANGKDTTVSGSLRSVLMQTTAANVGDEANILWLHVFFFEMITVYVVWLVGKHTKSFTILRQLYLTTKGDTNLWRAVHQPESILVQLIKQGQDVNDEIDTDQIYGNLEEVGARTLNPSAIRFLKRSNDFKATDVEKSQAVIKESGHRGSATYFESNEHDGNDSNNEEPEFGGVSPIRGLGDNNNQSSSSGRSSSYLRHSGGGSSGEGPSLMKSMSLMRTTSLGSKAVGGSVAMANRISTVFKSQALGKSKVLSFHKSSREKELENNSINNNDNNRENDEEDANIEFKSSGVSVKASKSGKGGGGGLFRYGDKKTVDGGAGSGGAKKLQTTPKATTTSRHMQKVSEENLTTIASPSSPSEISLAGTLTPPASGKSDSEISVAKTASPRSQEMKRSVKFEDEEAESSSPQALDYDEAEKMISPTPEKSNRADEDAMDDDDEELLEYSPSPLKKGESDDSNNSEKKKNVTRRPPGGPIAESANIKDDISDDDNNNNAEADAPPRAQLDRHAGSSRYAPTERPANSRGAARRIFGIFGDMGNLGRSVIGASIVRRGSNNNLNNNSNNNQDEDDETNELDITDDEVNLLTSSLTDTREIVAARNAALNRRNSSNEASARSDHQDHTETNAPPIHNRISSREELNQGADNEMFSPRKLAEMQFRKNQQSTTNNRGHRRTGSGNSFGRIDFNPSEIDLEEAKKVIMGRESLEYAIKQAQQVHEKNREDGNRDVAIDHEWWTGLDVSEDPNVVYSYSDMVGALPDVQQSRSVNTYDPETKSLISVWAENYVVLLTNIPKLKKFRKTLRGRLSGSLNMSNSSGTESENEKKRIIEETEQHRAFADEQYAAMESMFDEVFGEEFRGMIPVYDHRNADRLLDQRDEINNKLVQARGKCARLGEDPVKMADMGREMSFMRERNKSTESAGSITMRDVESQKSFIVNKAASFKKKKETSEDRSVELSKLEQELEVIDTMILEEREKAWNGVPGPSAFAVFATQTAAAMACQCLLHRGGANEFVVHPAPGPSDINWQTLLQPKRTSIVRFLFVYPAIFILILTPSTLIATMITSACTLKAPSDSMEKFLEWYCDEKEVEGLRLLVSGILPPILLTLWEVFAVSFFLLYLVHAQNVHVSLSATDQRFMKFYYLWGLLNVLIGGITGGAISGIMQKALQEGTTVTTLQQQFGSVLPLSSNFFLSFVFYRAVFIPSYRLIFPHPGVICYTVNTYLRCCFGCTPTKRDRTMKYSPRAMRAGREAGLFSVIILLGLTFSVISPLIALVCALFFLCNFIIWRYHLLYVYERGYESNGTVFYSSAELIIWSLLIAQTFVSSVMFAKSAYSQAMMLYITVPYYLYSRWQTIVGKFGDARTWSVPLGETVKSPTTDFGGEIYTHPALRVGARGWHPDVGKVWRGYPGVVSKRTL